MTLLVIEWLKIPLAGLPRWGWVLLILLSVLEMVLGRSKDPRWRSVAESLRHILGFILIPVLSKVPVIGLLILGILKTLCIIPDQTNSTKQ
jgi:hypothetical protein